MGFILSKTSDLETLLSHKDEKGRTPLHHSIRANNPDLFRALVSHGASIQVSGVFFLVLLWFIFRFLDF